MTTKEKMIETIQEMPEDSTAEEILRELAFECMVERGLKDVREGRTLSSEEMSRRIEQWRA